MRSGFPSSAHRARSSTRRHTHANRRATRLVAAASLLSLSCVLAVAAQQPRSYPPTRKADHVDTYHGVQVADPYRWLEDDNSPETAAWVEAQNKVTFALSRQASRIARSCGDAAAGAERLRALLRAVPQGAVRLLQEERRPAEPERALHPEGLRRHARGPDRSERVVGTTAPVPLTTFAPSKDAKYAVYGKSPSGSDWQEYHVIELATKKTLDDTLEWVKVSSVAWRGDGFYYSRYPAPDQAQGQGRHQREPPGVLPPGRHAAVAGSSWSIAIRRIPQRFHTVRDDRRRAVRGADGLGARQGQGGQRAVRPRSRAPATRSSRRSSPTSRDDSFNVVDSVGDKLLVATNKAAPNGRVVLIDPKQPAEANWKIVLRERPEPLDSVSTAGGKLFATYMKDVTTRAYVHAWTARSRTRSRCPASARASGFGGKRDEHVRVLHLHLAERSADDLPLRHRARRRRSVFRAAEGPGLRPGGVRDEAGLLHQQGRHARCRCSSSTRRA